jgi:hypothetical protein
MLHVHLHLLYLCSKMCRVLVTEQCGREFGVALQHSVLAIVVTIRYLDTSELSVALQQSVLSIVVTIRYLDTSLGRLDTVCFISE